MKTNVQETSIEAYHDLKNLNGKQKEVYNAIKKLGEACNLDVAYELRIPINRITPRTNELVRLGFVEESRRDITPRTGRRVIFWRTVRGGL